MDLEKITTEKTSGAAGPAVKLSPDRMELLQRTLDIRQALGKVSRNLTDLVREMRERHE